MNVAGVSHFGLLIAYVLPGFVTLAAVRPWSTLVADWLSASPTVPAGIESVVFVTLASVVCGMTVNAARWALIDTAHHMTGLRRPNWDDASLETRLPAFQAIVGWHYQHYQFYASMAIVLPIVFASQLTSGSLTILRVVLLIALEILFLATSRNTLGKYYHRATTLLTSESSIERSETMANGSHPPKPVPQKPTTETKKPKQPKSAGK